MFNIDEKPTFTTPVVVTMPDGSQQDFTAAFEALPIDTFSSYDLATAQGCRDFLTTALLSVGDVVDSKGHAVPSTPDLLAKLINLPWARSPLVRAYLDGLNRAQAGN